MALLSNAWIILLEDDSPYRESLCALLVMARLSMSYFYSWCMFSSLWFRSFLILYADRGLVKNGQPNLALFSQLYWLVCGSFVAFFFGVWPLGHVIKGRYLLADSNRGRACMLGIMPDNSFEEFTKMKFIGIAFNLLVLFRISKNIPQWSMSQGCHDLSWWV